jgi:hypothetical protein
MYWKKSDWSAAELLTVTTLADSGPGSLREALSASGNRIVVFAVSGVIAVKSELDIDDPFCWVCGYTAGKNGVVLVGDGTVDSIVNVNTSDVILQGLTILCNNDGEGTRSLSVANRGENPRRIWLQHLATGVSEDENVIIWYDTQDVTYKDCISAFSLLPDGKGPNLGSEGGGNYWVERNIFYGHRQRLPRTKADGGPIHLVNNLSMNHQGSGASVRNTDGCELHAYGNIDWQEAGNADYYISTDSDSPVFHDDNWLIRGSERTTDGIVKDGKGIWSEAGFSYIDTPDELLGVLGANTGNQFYLDDSYQFRPRNDPFTDYVLDLVADGKFAEVKSSYNISGWVAVANETISRTLDAGKLFDAALQGGVPDVPLPKPDPEPEPDPGDPPEPEPEQPPVEVDLSAIEERLDSIDSKLDEVVGFTQALRSAMR